MNEAVLLAWTRRLEDGDDERRRAAADELAALGEAGDTEALALLLNVMADSNWRVRRVATAALVRVRDDRLLPTLAAALRVENPGLRNAAMEVLVRMGPPAVPYLLRSLGDRDPDVRIFAALTLGELRSRDALAPLVEMLSDVNENVRHASAESLGKIGDRRAVAPLLRCLEQGDFWVQYPSVLALGELGDDEAVPPLLHFLDDELLRQPAIEALGRIGDERAVGRIVRFLSDPARDLRHAALKSLVELHRRAQMRRSLVSSHAHAGEAPAAVHALQDASVLDALLAASADSEEGLRRSAIVALGWLGDPAAVPRLVETLRDVGVAETAREALHQLGLLATPRLLEALGDPDPEVRHLVVDCLGRIGDAAAIPRLLMLLGDENGEVRHAAAAALARIPSPAALGPLVGLLADEYLDVREVAVSAIARLLRDVDARTRGSVLGSIGPLLRSHDPRIREAAVRTASAVDLPEAVEAMHEALRDEDAGVRREAVRALGHRPSDAALSSLVAALSDPSMEVRKAATGAIGSQRGDRVPSALRGALQDSDPWVRYFAARAVSSGGWAEAWPELVASLSDRHGQVRIAALEALSSAAPSAPVVSAVADRLGDADADVRAAACSALGRLGDPRSTGQLVACVDDENWRVRAAAVASLGRLRDPAGLPALVRAMRDDDPLVRKGAVEAMAETEDAAALPSLIGLLADEQMVVLAFSALTRLAERNPDEFARLLPHEDPGIRQLLVEVAGKGLVRACGPAIRRLLEDSSAAVRRSSCAALAELGDSGAVATLVDRATVDPDDRVRDAAREAVGRLSRR